MIQFLKQLEANATFLIYRLTSFLHKTIIWLKCIPIIQKGKFWQEFFLIISIAGKSTYIPYIQKGFGGHPQESQVSFSDCLWSIIFLSVNFSHFPLLSNHQANFNHTWYKTSFDIQGNSSLFQMKDYALWRRLIQAMPAA